MNQMPFSASAAKHLLAAPLPGISSQHGGACRIKPSDVASQKVPDASTTTSKNCRGESSLFSTGTGESSKYSNRDVRVIAQRIFSVPRHACNKGSLTVLIPAQRCPSNQAITL